MALQDEIDSIAYPPTHRYKLEGMVPLGPLADRVKVIEEEFPDFFKSGTLLDVGCNKGFFSLYHKGPVVGIDPSEECITLCNKLGTFNERFFQSTFGELHLNATYDKIFIGNGHHYPFIETGGWSWVEKLGNLCVTGGLVLLEGPTSMESVDAKNCIPTKLASEFNQERLIEVFTQLFTLEKIVPSPLPQRYFLLFKKRRPCDIYQTYLTILYTLAAGYVSKSDVVLEICTRHDRGIISKSIIPHSKYILVDKDPMRLGLTLNAVKDELPGCDVAISTAVFHHTAPENVEQLFHNIAKNTRRVMIISGPADDMEEIYGDHLYHLNHEELETIANNLGWTLIFHKRTGLKTFTHNEYFFVFVKGGGS